MAVIKIERALAPLAPIGYDPRFKHWGKLMRSPADINLEEKFGYAINGPLAKWGETVAVEGPTFIVLASETGSMKRHDYGYALVSVDADGATTWIPDEHVKGQIAMTETVLPDTVKAKAANSILYAYAAYAWLCFTVDAARAAKPEKVCPLCQGRIRNAESLCRTCLELAIRQLDSLETAEMALHAADYAIRRIQS